ncbi:MAG: hypothetical protein E6I38_03620 [Chloroflexi bacterium]|nr:MAG: hypothetical protein E6I38_03620 [Chloroflexota bacterium]
MRCVYDEPVASAESRPAVEGPAGWSGPYGYTLVTWEVDFRAGGASRLRVRSPEGQDRLVEGVQLEIVEPERVVFRGDPGVEELSKATGTLSFRRA